MAEDDAEVALDPFGAHWDVDKGGDHRSLRSELPLALHDRRQSSWAAGAIHGIHTDAALQLHRMPLPKS
jgi:hypothetical protein